MASVAPQQRNVSGDGDRVQRLAWDWARGTDEPTWLLLLGAAMDTIGGGNGDLAGAKRRRDDARAIIAVGAPEGR